MQQENQADIFSRGAIQLTYNTLRKNAPQLALKVRNILGQQALPKNKGATNNEISDHFLVTLDSFDVRAIVETLVALEKESNDGGAVMINSLTGDWVALAQLMISQLRPPST